MINDDELSDDELLQILKDLLNEPSCVPDEELSDEDREFLARKRAQRNHWWTEKILQQLTQTCW